MTLPNELTGTYVVDMPYLPAELSYGATDDVDWLYRMAEAQRLVKGQTRFTNLQLSYYDSYLATESPTVQHIRDLWLSIAFGLVTRNAQTQDLQATKLTTFNKRFWSSLNSAGFINQYTYTLDDTLPAGAPYTGLLGTLARSAGELDLAGKLPLAILEELCAVYFTAHQLTGTTAAAKHASLLTLLQVSQGRFAAMEAALNQFYNQPNSAQPIGARPALQQVRRSLLTPNDWTNLRLRYVLGELTDELITLVEYLQDWATNAPQAAVLYGLVPGDPCQYTNVISLGLAFNKPAGPPGAYLALAVWGLTQACRVLTNLADAIRVPYSLYLQDPAYEQNRYDAAAHLATVVDAFTLLGTWNTYAEAKSYAASTLSQVRDLLRTNTQLLSIPADGPTRLVVN